MATMSQEGIAETRPAPAPPIKAVVVEDEGLFRDLLTTCLAQRGHMDVLAGFGDTDSALAQIPMLGPDVALLDIDLPGSVDGVGLGLELRKLMPALGIVLLSNHALPQLLTSLPREAVAGWSYLIKRSVGDVATLIRAVTGAISGLVTIDSSLVSGGPAREGSPLQRLTRRQREVLDLIAQGYTNAAIADALVVSEKSVEKHISSLYLELGINREDAALQPRVQAVLTYLRDVSPGHTVSRVAGRTLRP